MKILRVIAGATLAMTAGAGLISAPAAAQDATKGMIAIKIRVADFERATRFYTLLGMTAGTKYNEHEWQLRWPGGFRGSEVILVADPGDRSGLLKGRGFMMVSVADVTETVRQLRAAGFAAEGRAVSLPQATIMVIQDPDGNGVELVGGPFGAAKAPRR